MPVSFANVQDEILRVIRGLGVTPDSGAITWIDEHKRAAKSLVTLDIVSAAALQNRETIDLDADPDTWALSTLYYIRVQVRAESVNNKPGVDAMVALEGIRAGLFRPDLDIDRTILSIQPDNTTFVHHISYPHQGRMVSAYAFEIGFRAVVDYPLSGDVPATPNMQQVILDTGDVEIGEPSPVELSATINRS